MVIDLVPLAKKNMSVSGIVNFLAKTSNTGNWLLMVLFLESRVRILKAKKLTVVQQLHFELYNVNSFKAHTKSIFHRITQKSKLKI